MLLCDACGDVQWAIERLGLKVMAVCTGCKELGSQYQLIGEENDMRIEFIHEDCKNRFCLPPGVFFMPAVELSAVELSKEGR